MCERIGTITWKEDKVEREHIEVEAFIVLQTKSRRLDESWQGRWLRWRSARGRTRLIIFEGEEECDDGVLEERVWESKLVLGEGGPTACVGLE